MKKPRGSLTNLPRRRGMDESGRLDLDWTAWIRSGEGERALADRNRTTVVVRRGQQRESSPMHIVRADLP